MSYDKFSCLSLTCTLLRSWKTSTWWKTLLPMFFVTASVPFAKIYTRKELVMIEIYINQFNTSLYSPEIKNLYFHLPRVLILGTHHCVNTCCESFKRCVALVHIFSSWCLWIKHETHNIIYLTLCGIFS